MNTSKVKWQAEEVIGKHRVYARATRSEIIVRVENDGDTSKFAEWGMPKMLGLLAAMHQASLQTSDEDIKPQVLRDSLAKKGTHE